MNKYQDELDKLKAWCYLYPETKLIEDKFNHSFNTLQELIDNYKQLKNEFCLQCGKYKNEHLGACEGCRWKDVQV